ncbi:agglutinin biogenesis protein MshP [Massilia polaris]|nr:agglutinin biogenesis protein MshP [Massilia polaris]
MTHNIRSAMPALVRSRGVGLVTAIFLLVVIATLAVAMVTVFTTQQTSSALDIQGARAYQAARAGLEWGIFKQARQGTCDAESSFSMDGATSLRGFTVTVRCVRAAGPATDSGVEGALDRWKVTATACNAPNAGGLCPNPVNTSDYVQRAMEATF